MEDCITHEWLKFPQFLIRYPIGSTAKWVYALLYNELLCGGKCDREGHLYVTLTVVRMAKQLSKSPSSIKRGLRELEQAGLIERRSQKIGTVTKTYLLPPEDGVRKTL